MFPESFISPTSQTTLRDGPEYIRTRSLEARLCNGAVITCYVKKLWLLQAAAAGLVTGILALTGHIAAVVLHAVGGLYAIGLISVAAYRARTRKHMTVVAVMIGANLTGLVWTFIADSSVVIILHVFVGIAASAGALFLALPSYE